MVAWVLFYPFLMELELMDLRNRLKEETQSLHDNIEQTFLFKKILQHEITLSDYQRLIKKFYGFIIPCEELIDSLTNKYKLNARKKTPWLIQDLSALKIPTNNDSNLPKCTDLPELCEHEHVLGYLYVMEGATLGGQIITKMLNTQLALTQDSGVRFFYGYGHKTKSMWNDFCSQLSNISDTEQQNMIIHSASSTFIRLSKWMQKGVMHE